MYGEFIRSAFIKDVFYNFFFLIWIPVIYFGFGLYKEEGRGCALTFLVIFFGGAALVDFSTKWAYYADYVNYIRQGDSYVMEKICLVEDVADALSTAIVDAQQRLECSDGTHLELRHRREYQRIYPKVGRAFQARYLPKSGMVVELAPLDGGTLDTCGIMEMDRSYIAQQSRHSKRALHVNHSPWYAGLERRRVTPSCFLGHLNNENNGDNRLQHSSPSLGAEFSYILGPAHVAGDLSASAEFSAGALRSPTVARLWSALSLNVSGGLVLAVNVSVHLQSLISNPHLNHSPSGGR